MGMDRVRSVKGGGDALRLLDGSLAIALIYSFFQPWLSFMGTPVAAHRIRETLGGPHRLASAFTREAQVSLDYSLSLFLWAVPAAAAVTIFLCLRRGAGPRLRAAAGLATGLLATAAFLFLRRQLQSYPFQRLEEGAWLTLLCGLGLLGIAALRAALGIALGKGRR